MGYESNMKEFSTEFNTWQEKALKAIGIFGEADAKLRCPVGQYNDGKVGGNLRSSINHKVNKAKKVTYLGTNSDYALPVEKGSVPHTIRPKTANTLSWISKGGNRFYAKSVNHPGTKAQPFLTPAIEKNMKKLETLVNKIKFAGGKNGAG